MIAKKLQFYRKNDRNYDSVLFADNPRRFFCVKMPKSPTKRIRRSDTPFTKDEEVWIVRHSGDKTQTELRRALEGILWALGRRYFSSFTLLFLTHILRHVLCQNWSKNSQKHHEFGSPAVGMGSDEICKIFQEKNAWQLRS